MEHANNQEENEATSQSRLYFIKTDGMLQFGGNGVYTLYVGAVSFANAVEKAEKYIEEKSVYLPDSWLIRKIEFLADANFDSLVGNTLVL